MPSPTSPLKSLSRPLLLLTAGCLAVLAASLVLMLVDPRQLMGASVWLKPAKFAASIAIAAGDAGGAAAAHSAARGRRPARDAVIVFTSVLELVIITVQAARGVPSHFNATSALNIALFSAMGIGISIFTVAVAYVTLHAFRQRFADRALGMGDSPRPRDDAGGQRDRVRDAAPHARPARPACAPGTRRRWWARTPSASPTAAPACPSPGGARKAATCACRTSSASTRCSSCRWSAGGWDGAAAAAPPARRAPPA